MLAFTETEGVEKRIDYLKYGTVITEKYEENERIDDAINKVYIKTIIADIRRNFSEQYLIQISNKVNSASIVS